MVPAYGQAILRNKALILRRSFRLETGVSGRYASSSSAQLETRWPSESEQHEAEAQAHTRSQADEVQSQTSSSTSASAKLFADAALGEAEEAAALNASQNPLVSQAVSDAKNENWTGDEPLHDAVLRMLVDAHRPLRGPSIRSADEKMRERPPVPSLSNSSSPISIASATVTDSESTYNPNWQLRATEPLLPAVEGHRPWHTTFKPPAHATASVKLGNFAPRSARSSSPTSSSSSGLNGDEGLPVEPAAKRRSESAQRLGRARESTIDYRMGIRGGQCAEGAPRRPMPVNMKGWKSLVEERIERARQQGHFKAIKGRGQPLVRDTAERNPFIGREEFLMNRIVRRNNAAPPWIDLQTELDAAVSAFRSSLQESWTRRAIRMLTVNRSHSTHAQLTVEEASVLRDSEWEARERAYHETAIAELNSLVRRYNGVAPYTVRRTVLEREAELAQVYRESAEGIVLGVRGRLKSGAVENRPFGVSVSEDEDRYGSGSGGTSFSGSSSGLAVDERERIGLWEVVRGWFSR